MLYQDKLYSLENKVNSLENQVNSLENKMLQENQRKMNLFISNLLRDFVTKMVQQKEGTKSKRPSKASQDNEKIEGSAAPA